MNSSARAWLPRLAALVVVIVAGLALYGLGPGGNFYLKNSRAPLAPAIDAPYYRESLLHVGLAHMLGLTGALQFRVFVLGFWWTGVAVLLFGLRLPLLHALSVALVVLSHSSAMIVHAWACHPDAPVFLLTALLLVVRRPRLSAVLAALMAFANIPLTLVVCASLAGLWLAQGERARAVAACVGGFVGGCLCKLTLWLCGVQLAHDRLGLATRSDLAAVMHRWAAGWPTLYSLHLAHLLWLPALFLSLRRTHPRVARALLASQLLALLAASLAEDTTRIFAIAAWGPLVACLALALERPAPGRSWLRPLVLVGAIVSLLGPKSFAWKGELRGLDEARAYRRAHLP